MAQTKLSIMPVTWTNKRETKNHVQISSLAFARKVNLIDQRCDLSRYWVTATTPPTSPPMQGRKGRMRGRKRFTSAKWKARKQGIVWPQRNALQESTRKLQESFCLNKMHCRNRPVCCRNRFASAKCTAGTVLQDKLKHSCAPVWGKSSTFNFAAGQVETFLCTSAGEKLDFQLLPH